MSNPVRQIYQTKLKTFSLNITEKGILIKNITYSERSVLAASQLKL